MGIYSCLGKTLDEVRDSLYNGKSGIIFDPVRKEMGFLSALTGHLEIPNLKGVLSRNQRVYMQLPDNVAKVNTSVIVNGNVLNNDESYWDKVRPYALTAKESNIYKMVDSIKNVPLYRNIYTVLNTVFNGYYNTKYVGFGPYFKVFSFNNLEGARFQMGARTTDDLSKKWRFMLYSAYGTKDRNFKGGGTVEYMFNNQPTKKLTLSFKHE